MHGNLLEASQHDSDRCADGSFSRENVILQVKIRYLHQYDGGGISNRDNNVVY